MKGLLLAGAASLLFPFLVMLLFRAITSRRRAAGMVRVFLATVPLYVGAYAVTPADLGFLPPWLMEPRYVPACAFGLLVYSAFFFGGWLQVYNLADRGCALHILLAIAESPDGALSAAEIKTRYERGRGLHWMPDKRIEGILELGLAAPRHGRLHAKPKGARVARRRAVGQHHIDGVRLQLRQQVAQIA